MPDSQEACKAKTMSSFEVLKDSPLWSQLRLLVAFIGLGRENCSSKYFVWAFELIGLDTFISVLLSVACLPGNSVGRESEMVEVLSQ